MISELYMTTHTAAAVTNTPERMNISMSPSNSPVNQLRASNGNSQNVRSSAPMSEYEILETTSSRRFVLPRTLRSAIPSPMTASDAPIENKAAEEVLTPTTARMIPSIPVSQPMRT